MIRELQARRDLKALLGDLWPALFLVGLLWAARYWNSQAFGLYEDDLTHLPTAAAMTLGQAAAYAFDMKRILLLHGGGHPLHYTFIYLLTNIGWRLGDFHALYVIGFLIEAGNVALFFLLLRRVLDWRLGLVGGIAYVLYAADTTQTYLTLALGLHPCITIFLLAAHAYLRDKKWLAYLLSPLMLLTYETIYPVFFALPLLAWVRGRRRWRELLYHTTTVGGILVLFAGWRFAVGDDRIGGLGLKGALFTPLVHMAEGPIVSIGTYLYRAVQAVRGADFEVAVAALVGTAVFAYVLTRPSLRGMPASPTRLSRPLSDLTKTVGGWRSISAAYAQLPGDLTRLFRSSAAGAAMLVMAYPLTFTVRAYAISGRDTRVHAAGVLGAAILVGSLILIALWLADAVGRRRAVSLLLALWLGLLLGYGFLIQRDYRLAWTYQRQFWTSLVKLIPDVGNGDSILVEPQGLRDTRQIGANYWNLPVVLEQIYDFPDGWHDPVWTYRLTDAWQDNISAGDGNLVLDALTVFAPPDTFRKVDASEAILIETDSGKLSRRSRPLVIDGSAVSFQETNRQGEPPFPHGFLYQYLIQPIGSRGSGE